ncbi:RNA-directed DNA polymerase, eukaryota [Tanacetum coccineum]
MGDFNEVRNKNERFGTIFNVHGANAFNSFISMANLEEVPLGGCSFTWCHRSASKMSKLDRFLMSESLLKGFENFVNEVWREAPVDNSNAMINMMNKLKYLKKKIRVWNGMRQSPKTRKHVLKQELADLEMIIDKGDASSDTLHKRVEVVKSIQEVDKLCAMEASQKAKIKWAIEGDENSKYYHGILNKKRNQLSIRGVLVEGDWVENPNMVKNEFLNHFKNRFDRPKSVRPMLNMEFPHHLNSMQQLDLEAEVSNEEIKKAVWDCGVDKSPGPDGFTFGFYKRFWSLIEKDVLAAVKYFFHYSRIPKGCNLSFIALIPKTPEAKMVKNFRPISLIGSLYKIIVVVLEDIVNEVQSAFVADRQILDGPFILNEVLQWCKLKKKHSFILKIDFEKAYDSVRWDYLDDVLRKFGFGEKWCGWIQESIHGEDGKNGSGFKVGYKSIWRSILQEVETLKIKGFRCPPHRLYALGSEEDVSGVEQEQVKDLATYVDKGVVSLVSHLIGGFSDCVLINSMDKAVPIKVTFMRVECEKDCLPTRLNISRRGKVLTFDEWRFLDRKSSDSSSKIKGC